MSGIISVPAKSVVHCVAGPLSCKARKEKVGEMEMGVPLSEVASLSQRPTVTSGATAL